MDLQQCQHAQHLQQLQHAQHLQRVQHLQPKRQGKLLVSGVSEHLNERSPVLSSHLPRHRNRQVSLSLFTIEIYYLRSRSSIRDTVLVQHIQRLQQLQQVQQLHHVQHLQQHHQAGRQAVHIRKKSYEIE